MNGNLLKYLVSTVFALVFCSTPSFPASTNIHSSTPAHKETLKQRYDSLVCAIAFISTERGTGTGFFIDPNGDIVTAAHVISSKNFKMVLNQPAFDVAVDQNIKITPHNQAAFPLPAAAVDVDLVESSTDLAFIHTNQQPPCWIPLGDSSKIGTGDHLVSIGFPGIDNGNPVLYEGFLSGRFKHPPIPIAQVNGQSIVPQYEILKVQMPITPGASGSPIIDDSGRAVGVVSEAPMIWTQDLERVTQVASTGSGISLSGFDAVKILGQLALVVREFETTGAGYAVPISDLNPKRAADHAVSTRGR